MEKDLQTKILDFLKDNKHFAVKTIVSNKSGIPDILACINGKFVGIEVKDTNKQPTRIQLYKLQGIRKSGGHSTWVDNFEDFKKFYSEIIK